MKNFIASILAAILVTTAAADAQGNRQLDADSKAFSYAGKSYSYFLSTAKASKGTKTSKVSRESFSFSYSMSYPPPDCQMLTFAACVIYIVELEVPDVNNNFYAWQAMNGTTLGTFFTEDAAIKELTGSRGYVRAPFGKSQEVYSGCYKGNATLEIDPVYFPDKPDCNGETLILLL